MAIVLLASVSLLALVVSSRPILPDSDRGDFDSTSSILLSTLQAPFQIRSGVDLKFDAARFHPQERKQRIEGFSELNAESVAIDASFGMPPDAGPSLAALVGEVTDRQDAFHADEFDDTRDSHIIDEPVSSEPVADEQQNVPINQPPSAPLVVLAFSCVAAFLALASIAVMLYIVKSISFQMLVSKTVWELLPRFWKCRPQSRADKGGTTEKHLLDGGCLLLQTEVGQQRLLNTGEGSIGRHDLYMDVKPLYFEAPSDIQSEWDDVDEKYHDALDVTPLPFLDDLLLIENEPHQFRDDPPLLPSYPLDRPTSDRSTPVIRETSLPISRPAWSLHAIDSPAPVLSSCEDGSVDSIPHPLIHPRRRAYRYAAPEFDIVLAMQLRPALGIGADSAWMVRFLMAVFGWFAVALTGNTR